MSTVGRNEEVIKEYIRNQDKLDRLENQGKLFGNKGPYRAASNPHLWWGLLIPGLSADRLDDTGAPALAIPGSGVCIARLDRGTEAAFRRGSSHNKSLHLSA